AGVGPARPDPGDARPPGRERRQEPGGLPVSPTPSRPTVGPLRGWARDALVALLVEMDGDLAGAVRAVDNPKRTVADVHAWLARIVADAARLDELRRLIQHHEPSESGSAAHAEETR